MAEIKEMCKSEVGRIAEIDRTEQVTLGYFVRDGRLESEPVDWRVPRWYDEGEPEHSVPGLVQAWQALLDQGGTMLGAVDGGRLVGVAIYRPDLAEAMGQLAVLYVSNGHRRQGIATRLTGEVARLARQEGARELYVTATPSQSAVGFYLSQGFRLAEEPHPALYALEPEDIHMIMIL